MWRLSDWTKRDPSLKCVSTTDVISSYFPKSYGEIALHFCRRNEPMRSLLPGFRTRHCGTQTIQTIYKYTAACGVFELVQTTWWGLVMKGGSEGSNLQTAGPDVCPPPGRTESSMRGTDDDWQWWGPAERTTMRLYHRTVPGVSSVSLGFLHHPATCWSHQPITISWSLTTFSAWFSLLYFVVVVTCSLLHMHCLHIGVQYNLHYFHSTLFLLALFLFFNPFFCLFYVLYILCCIVGGARDFTL